MVATLPKAEVLFGAATVALYFVPEGEQRRACHRAMELPRDYREGEDDPAVRYLRAVECAANLARADNR